MIFLMPGKEEGYIDVLEKGYRRDGIVKGLVKRREGEEVLKKGFFLMRRRRGGEEGKGEGEGGGAVLKKVSSTAGIVVGAKKKAKVGWGRGNSSDDHDDDDGTTWEERATEWQLEVERWVIEDSSAGEMAKRAFVSHVRAYATHVAKERAFFDVKELHLGHLAKAFALRDRPGSMMMGRKGVTTAIVTKRRKSSQTGGVSKKRMLDHDHNSRDGESGDTRSRNDKTDSHAPMQDAGKKMIAKMKEHMAAAGEFNIG